MTIASVILAIALLGHTAASYSTTQLATMERSRSEGVQIAQEFLERLRSDDDWGTLFSRLTVLERQAATAPAGTVRLNSGKNGYPVTAYYPSFTLAPTVDEVAVLVECPYVIPAGSTVPVLREDAPLSRFGLPADLDGDSVVDTDNHATDYVALPVIVTFRMRLQGDRPHEMRITTWLRGWH